MKRIRIHLGPMPEMLRAIITDLLRSEGDMLVVGRSEDGEGALVDAREDQADVLITQDGAGSRPDCLQAILSPEPLAVFAVSVDGKKADAVSLVHRSVSLEPQSGPALATAVRSLAQESGASAPP